MNISFTDIPQLLQVFKLTLSSNKVRKVKSSWQEYLFAKKFSLNYPKNKKMLNDTVWFTEISNGKFRINSRAIYRNLSSEIVTKLAQNLSVSEILDWIKNETIKAFREKYSQNPQVGALNKAIGGWNELIATSLLSEIIFDLNKETGMCIAAFSMPNSKLQLEGIDEAYSNFLNLFTKDNFANINNSLSKIQPFKDKIFMPQSRLHYSCY